MKRSPVLVTAVFLMLLSFTHSAMAQLFARFVNPQVEVTITHPPGFPFTVDRAAVLPRGGDCAREFSDAVVQRFIENDVELVDRQHIETVLAEQNLGATGRVDTQTAARLGELLGPTVLVLTDVQRCAVEQQNLYDDVTTLGGDKRRQYIARTRGSFKGSIRVIDLATGRISTARTIGTDHTKENTSLEGYPEFPPRYEVQDRMLGKATWEVHKLFFPWDERQNLYFFNDDECNLREAFKLLEIGDHESARERSAENLEACKRADVKPKFLARAYYNLGMMHFIQARYDEALERLREAFRIDGGSIIGESIEACRKAQRLAEAMAEMEDATEIGSVLADQEIGSSAGGAPGRTAEAAPQSSSESIEERLRQLKTLLDNGLITQEEYETKRDEILSAL